MQQLVAVFPKMHTLQLTCLVNDSAMIVDATWISRDVFPKLITLICRAPCIDVHFDLLSSDVNMICRGLGENRLA